LHHLAVSWSNSIFRVVTARYVPALSIQLDFHLDMQTCSNSFTPLTFTIFQIPFLNFPSLIYIVFLSTSFILIRARFQHFLIIYDFLAEIIYIPICIPGETNNVISHTRIFHGARLRSETFIATKLRSVAATACLVHLPRNVLPRLLWRSANIPCLPHLPPSAVSGPSNRRCPRL